MPPRLFAALLALSVCVQGAPPAKPWQRIDGCRWKADRWNDGDSFHVVTGDANREIVARLYFVDSPEAETAFRDRLGEQAASWGITRQQATVIAHEAAAFTKNQLTAPFTVWTRWRSALGRSALGRRYCIIITADGRDLNELLVENGLARIYGTRTALYDGRDSRAYLARLAELEAVAKQGSASEAVGKNGRLILKSTGPVQSLAAVIPERGRSRHSEAASMTAPFALAR